MSYSIEAAWSPEAPSSAYFSSYHSTRAPANADVLEGTLQFRSLSGID